jgi:tetratricopeptide (TPR) repeat protein
MRLAALLLLFHLLTSCATVPRQPPPRDRFPLDPREGLTGPFPSEVETGWQALLAGDAGKAREAFLRAQKSQPGLAAQIGSIEALVAEGSLQEALSACNFAFGEGSPTTALLVSCGEARARSGQALAAWDLYRQAAAGVQGRPGLAARAEELRLQARDQSRREAQEAAGHRDWKTARQAAALAMELDPGSSKARETAADVELEAGDPAKALGLYSEALELDPLDRTLSEKMARLALERSDYAVAIPVLERLGVQDPRFAAQAAEARLAFRIGNWPEAERSAALSTRLTRGDAARLLWWMVPEVREAKVTAGVIASDALGRSDSLEVSRAISLGLLDADRETHRARPDAVLSFSAAARLYLRLLTLLRPGESGPCPRGDAPSGPEAIRIARDCGILAEDDGPPVTGPAFTAAIDRIRMLAARGEKQPAEAARNPK